MSTPFHSRAAVGLRRPRSVSRNVSPEGDTAHYGGPSPWGRSVDRSSAARFQATADHSRCATIWRSWQAFHMDSRGWSDIAYSSGVCPHGHRYEGRGPGVRTAANGTSAGNRRSLATVYIAGDNDPLTDDAKRAFLDESRRLARLRWDHSDWKSTSCAGDPIRAWEAQGWPAPAGTPAPPPPPPEPQEEDMRIMDCPGKPAVLIGGTEGPKFLPTKADRDAYRALDVPAHLVDLGQYLRVIAILWSEPIPEPGDPSVDDRLVAIERKIDELASASS